MRVTIDDIRALMLEVCRGAGISADDTDFVVDHFLAGELRGKPSHGIAKFCFESQFFAQREGSPEITRDHRALAIIDAHREVGPISANYAVQVAMGKARDFGVGIVGMINTQRYGILAPWSEEIARHGFVGVVMNTSRADSTVHGATEPFLGVNPLSFAFPTLDGVLAADMSTTRAAMGVLWECRRNGAALPPGCFVDGTGQFTDDPEEAAAAVVFADHKGFAVSLLVQILTGSLFGFPMGRDVQSTWTTGYTFMAIDPSFGGELAGFAAGNSRLVQVMEKVTTREAGALRLPGRLGNERMTAALEAGYLDIPELTYRRLLACSYGHLDRDASASLGSRR